MTVASLDQVLAGLRSDYRRAGLHRGRTLGRAVADAVATHAGDPVLFLGATAERLSVGELWHDALRLAGALHRDGLRPGEIAGILLPNSRRAWTIYLACLAAGAVVVPIPPTQGIAEAAYCLDDSGATRFFVADRWRRADFAGALGPVRAARSLRTITVVGENVPADCEPFTRLERQMQDGVPAAALPPPGGAGADAFICYTSGSTAAPKGARHTHDTFLAELMQVRERSPGRPVVFTARPLGTMAGLLAVLRAMLRPAQTIVMDRWDTAAAIEIVREHHVTYLPTVPFMLTTMLDELAATGTRLPSLADVSCGGSSVPAALIERAHGHGIPAYRLFGSTEHPTVTSGHPDQDLPLRAGTDGGLLPGAALKIVDSGGGEVTAGEPGEILTRGPDQFGGYLGPTANEGAFTADGWLRSGDLGMLTQAGHLIVTGRAKDVIIRAGLNLVPAAIEDVLARHPLVAEVAVVGVADRRYGERPAAVVVLRDHRPLSLGDVQRHFAQAGVARQKTPEYLVVRTSMPRTASGKIAKRQLKEELESALAATGDEPGGES
jgi:acyl-CoA synthetase (AMP-forming)/AMP-acid ligase II